MRPIGKTGLYREKARQIAKARGAGWPSGNPPFDSATPANRSGISATRRRPISEPQSWQARMMPRRSSASIHRRIHATRSEEHTSELQSLMRISYAVFCLKKKKQNNNDHTRQAHA